MQAYSYLDIPQTGLMNMALDDAMLEFADTHRAIVLRLYAWSEPTLSLGYFQSLEERAAHRETAELPVVRRTTGGGAIVHHHDLTYALAMPQLQSDVGAAPAIYRGVHTALVTWLHEMGFEAKQWQNTYNLSTASVAKRPHGKPEFLCFQRRSEGDVVVGEHKVLGSAQRRRGGALLQHGSLLLATSPYAPALVGLRELQGSSGPVANHPRFAEEMLVRLERGIDALLQLPVKWKHNLTEIHSAGVTKMAKFASLDWLSRR